MKSNNTVAIFIDAENISSKYAERIFNEASNYGDIVIKRIFADWSSSTSIGWKENVSKYSLVPEQQFSHIKGKNSSDISLVINTLSVLFEKDIDTFCIASSDCDFTRLVQELRERGKLVVGFGEQKTAKPFINAFREFIYLDEITPDIIKKPTSNKQFMHPADNIVDNSIDSAKIVALKEIIEKLIEENGKAFYAQISNDMKNKFADFIPKNFGCSSFKQLIEKFLRKIGDYDIKTGDDGLAMYLIKRVKK